MLGTLAGFVVSVPGVILYKLGGSPAVLVLATLVFAAAAVAGARLPVLAARRGEREWSDETRGARLRPATAASRRPSNRTSSGSNPWPTQR